jgi:hypothetical protein
MIKPILYSVLILSAACSKKDGGNNQAPAAKTETPASPAKPADPASPAPGAPAAAPAAPAGKLDCDRVLPKDLRDKYLKDAKIENIPASFDYAAKCKIKYAEINATCHHNMTLGKQATLEALPKSNPTMKPIEGVPDSLAHTVAAGYQFHAYDQDSECMISGVLDKDLKIDGPAFVKDWLAALPPK